MPLPVQTKQPRKVCQKVKGGNYYFCAINMEKFWIMMLSRSPQNGTSIKAIHNLIHSFRSLHWLLATSFLNFILLLAMDTKAFIIVSYYELKIKLEMTTPEAASMQSQILFLTTVPYFPWTPELSVT